MYMLSALDVFCSEFTVQSASCENPSAPATGLGMNSTCRPAFTGFDMGFVRGAGRVAAVFGIVACGFATVSAERRPFGIEEFYRLVSPGSLTLSADGDTLVYRVTTRDLSRGESGADLWALDTRDGSTRRITFTDDASEGGAVFSADGDTIAFVAKRGDDDHAQIWLLPAKGGEASRLTDISTGVSDLAWSPDGKRIAFTSDVWPQCGADDVCNQDATGKRDDGPITAHVADELLFRHWASWARGPVTHVLSVGVADGAVVDHTPGDREAPAFVLGGGLRHGFSPDGKHLVFTKNPDPVERLAWSTNSDVWTVDVTAATQASASEDTNAATPDPVNLTADNAAWDGHPRYSPDGRWLAYTRQLRPGYESDRIRLVVRDLESGDVRDLTAGFDDWVGDFAWMPDSSGLLMTSSMRGSTHLYHVDLAKSSRRLVLSGMGSFSEVTPSPDGTVAYAVHRGIAEPREIWKIDLRKTNAAERLTFHNRAVEDEVDIRPAERVQVEVAPGRTIEMFLVKPHGFDPKKKYPAILNVHGGPQGQWTDSFRGDWQMYPGAGYVLAFANPSGSTGYGQQLTEEISGDWGGQVFRDLMAAADHVAALPYVDADRFGAMGWSYGGYMMNWFQGHTDRFATLACMMGLFDLRSFYYTTEELWFPEWDLVGTPWTSDQYERWNPAASVDKWKTSMLIVAGELDFRVPYTQSIGAFTALRRRDVPARLVVLPDSGHWPGWYDMALYYTAHLEWFHEWLGGDPPPWTTEDFARNAVFDAETGERIDRDEDGDKP